MLKLRHNPNRNMKKKNTIINSKAPVRTATPFSAIKQDRYQSTWDTQVCPRVGYLDCGFTGRLGI